MGRIIVIEGLDGSGKHTQSLILFDKLKSKYKVKLISMPNYESDSSGPVRMYLNREIADDPQKINPYASSSFFAVDRFINYYCNWKSFYEDKDSILICDRYSTSNMIYQLSKSKDWDKFLRWINEYEYDFLGIPRPDVVIYLRVPVQISQNLIHSRSEKCDLHESNLEFLKLCEKASDYSSKKLNWNVIECSDGNSMKQVDEISEQIYNIVKEHIG